MKNKAEDYIVHGKGEPVWYRAPKTVYCTSKEEFAEAAAKDFIEDANLQTEKGVEYIVGLSHGQSPADVYTYIYEHFGELKHPDRLHFTFINSKLKRQRGLKNVFDAVSLIRKLLKEGLITKDQIIGRSLDRENLEKYGEGLNKLLDRALKEHKKAGLDYIFVASDPKGLVAGITRNSPSFESKKYVELVTDTVEPELTFTPHFLKKSVRIAFLTTKSEKRRPLAWLFYRWAKPYESPSFLRFIPNVEERMTVFIDDQALTWPQVILNRKTNYGYTSIRVDTAIPFDIKSEEKMPIVLMIHGFLGLNTFDALLAFIPSHKYISAAMHYGSIPYDLPPREYSKFVAKNINHVVNYFGSKGHPVYIFDHSMANIYMMMINENLEGYPAVKKYVKGRIASNPFFGQEPKHAAQNFLDDVILKSKISLIDKVVFTAVGKAIPFQSKKLFRSSAMNAAEWLIRSDTFVTNRIWKAIKMRIMHIVSDMDALPALNRIPLEHTLNRLPIKIFAIQIQSALRESKRFDHRDGVDNFKANNIPVLILKSEIDPIAKYVKSAYPVDAGVQVMDITNQNERLIFREHLFYMIHPHTTINIIDHFIEDNLAK